MNKLENSMQEEEKMKARIITIACILVSFWVLSSANAATVTMNDNACTGIQGLEINGELYDVFFGAAYTGDDLDAAFAGQAISAAGACR